MKKMNNIKKVLSKEEIKLVKGGGWMYKANIGKIWRYFRDVGNGCPPPDPTDD